MIKISLSTKFSSAHLYHQKSWSPEENLKAFGKCYSEHGHGHNYKLEAEWLWDENSYDTLGIQQIQSVLQKILDIEAENLDHKHLNFDIEYFQNTIPTTENIALYILNRIKDKTNLKLSSLKVFEMSNLWAEIKNV